MSPLNPDLAAFRVRPKRSELVEVWWPEEELAQLFRWLELPEQRISLLGTPERALAEAASACTEFDLGWTIVGPRTAKWCLSYLAIEGLGFEGHHERFRTLCKLESSTWGVVEHFQLSMFVRHLVQVDCYNVLNSLGVELMFRRLQTIEFAHGERAREAEARSVGGKLTMEEQATFGAVVRQAGTLMVAPSLLDHVKAEVEKDVALQKNMRKAREERELNRKAAKDPKGKKNEEGAVSQLHAFDGYGDDQTPAAVTTYNPSLLSLPDAGNRAIPVAELLGDDGREIVSAFCRTRLLDRNEARKSLERLATAECLSRIQLTGDSPLYISTADLKDAFYHFELPIELRDFFSMRSVPAGAIGLEHLQGQALAPGVRVRPRLRVLPMGWSHALWWCQMIHQRIVSRVGATEQNSLEDKAVVPDGQCMHLEYIDNWVVMGTDKDRVSALAGAGVDALRNSGLVVHEVEHASKQIKVLGWEFDNNIFRPRPIRVWRVRKAFEYLLQRGSCTGRQLEKIVGHANFLCLGRRESLSVFGETYTFIKRNYWNKARIWKSVRRELDIFIGVCPLIWRDLAAPWETEVTAVDASDWGMGATTAVFDVEQVADLGQFSERWRFDYPHLSRPREHAFGMAVADDPQEAAAAAWASNEATNTGGAQPIRVVQPKSHDQIFKTASVSEKSRTAYLDCWDRMISYTSVRLDERSPPSLVDSCLEEMLNHMFEEGEDLSKANYMLAAVLFRMEEIGPSQVPSSSALGGGLPDDIKYAMNHNYLQEALMMAMCFVLYLRPGEVSRLRCRDLVPPVKSTKKSARTWSVVLHPVELEVASKTSEFDETVTFDDLETQFIPEAVSKHMRSRTRGKDQMLFTSNSIQLKAVMEEAAKAEHLQDFYDYDVQTIARNFNDKLIWHAPADQKAFKDGGHAARQA
ncbi:unnamed protein product [Durusdinium trenchii]|uniref:Reverse transcriptase domain-containing protein n=1 Tax=Durusdinium trenchii TaxID=1381693 RepID=A0ABP0HWI3_9DINO